jgi:hypothetical protein
LNKQQRETKRIFYGFLQVGRERTNYGFMMALPTVNFRAGRGRTRASCSALAFWNVEKYIFHPFAFKISLMRRAK